MSEDMANYSYRRSARRASGRSHKLIHRNKWEAIRVGLMCDDTASCWKSLAGFPHDGLLNKTKMDSIPRLGHHGCREHYFDSAIGHAFLPT